MTDVPYFSLYFYSFPSFNPALEEPSTRTEPLDANGTRSHSRLRIMMRIKPLAPLCHKEAPPGYATMLRAHIAAPAMRSLPQLGGYATGYTTTGLRSFYAATPLYAASRS